MKKLLQYKSERNVTGVILARVHRDNWIRAYTLAVFIFPFYLNLSFTEKNVKLR